MLNQQKKQIMSKAAISENKVCWSESNMYEHYKSLSTQCTQKGLIKFFFLILFECEIDKYILNF